MIFLPANRRQKAAAARRASAGGGAKRLQVVAGGSRLALDAPAGGLQAEFAAGKDASGDRIDHAWIGC